MKFSIIIPIYNVKDYVVECIESVLDQKNLDYECILINDGSTDGSEQIALSLIRDNSKFRMVHKQNGGLSEARNEGIKLAQGDYIIFLDSDDFIHPQYLDVITNVIAGHSPDLVYLNFDRRLSKNIFKNIETPLVEELSLSDLFKKPSYAWARVAKRELYDLAHFPVGLYYEDIYGAALLNSKVNKIVEVQDTLYAYRFRQGSITTNKSINQLSILDPLRALRMKVEKGELERKYYLEATANVAPSVLLIFSQTSKGLHTFGDVYLIGKAYRYFSYRDILGSNTRPLRKLAAVFLTSPLLTIFAAYALVIRKYIDTFLYSNDERFSNLN